MKTTIAILFAGTVLAAGAASAQNNAAQANAAQPPAAVEKGGTDHPAEKRAATDVAGPWVKLLDAGNWPEAWRQLAPAAQAQVTQATWNQTMPKARGPGGAVKSRTFRDADYTDSMPDAPPGEYVAVVYDVVFANGKKALETVVLMRVGNSWKVSGYFVN
jgi:hypothetical protein